MTSRRQWLRATRPPNSRRHARWHGQGLLHFVHLLDAFNHATGARRVLAVGADAAKPAAFLAARCPTIQTISHRIGARRHDFVFVISPRTDPALDPRT